MNAPVIKAEEVHKHFHSLEVLKGINLSVDGGEVVVIMGPSGSGKSTFLRCLNHLEKINGGRIEINGHFIGYRQAPDGRLIAFMAPGDRGGPFQLWTVAPNSAQTPPSQITKNLDLDPTSTPNWTT